MVIFYMVRFVCKNTTYRESYDGFKIMCLYSENLYVFQNFTHIFCCPQGNTVCTNVEHLILILKNIDSKSSSHQISVHDMKYL